MKNWQWHRQLRQLDWRGQQLTVTRLALALGVNRAHLTDVLNNTPGHGGQTRPKVARWLMRRYPEQAPALLRQLGWDTEGRRLAAGATVQETAYMQDVAAGRMFAELKE